MKKTLLIVLLSSIYSCYPLLPELIIGLGLMALFAQEQKPQPQSPRPNNEPEKINYSEIRKEIKHTIHYYFDPDNQSMEDKHYIYNLENTISNAIIEQMQSDISLTKHSLSNSYIHQKVTGALAQATFDKAKQLVSQEIYRVQSNPPINPSFLKHINSEQLKQSLAQQTLQRFEHSIETCHCNGCMENFLLSRLKLQVAHFVEEAFGISMPPSHTPPAGIPAQQNLLAAPNQCEYSEEEIYEVYPAGKRGQEYISQLERKKQYRSDMCLICQDEFSTLGKRANLFCGHSLCTNCLLRYFHIDKKTECPYRCTDHIEKTDFPISYLTPHLDIQRFKEDYPQLLNELRKLFPWA